MTFAHQGAQATWMMQDPEAWTDDDRRAWLESANVKSYDLKLLPKNLLGFKLTTVLADFRRREEDGLLLLESELLLLLLLLLFVVVVVVVCCC